MFRVNKTEPNKDDFRVMCVGVTCTIVILLGSLLIPRLPEYRWYRDFTALTPFHGVELISTKVISNSIMIEGVLIKRRCNFLSLTGYVINDLGRRARVVVDTSYRKSPASGNRPTSSLPEDWGPWQLISPFDNPVKWEIYAEHEKCATPPKEQTNLFASGEWINKNY